MVFESYGVEKYFDSHIKSANYLCRVMKYREAKVNESKMGFVSHTDKSFMSTIHQNRVNGLEIKAKDGEWFGVELSSSSSVVVMAGDAIMVGKLHSSSKYIYLNVNHYRHAIFGF